MKIEQKNSPNRLFAAAKSFVAFVLGVLVIFGNTATAQVTDLSVFRPSKGVWYTQGQEPNSGFSAIKMGSSSDVLVPADYDGDGTIDSAVWDRENATWQILKSTNGKVDTIAFSGTEVGTKYSQNDIPVSADFDGDGRADLAVWRPSTGFWYVLTSSSGFEDSQRLSFCWGQAGDVPVPADYDGDGRSDYAVFRPSDNRWYIFESRSQTWSAPAFGQQGDLLVPADYTGDGKADLAVYRNGTWTVFDVATGETDTFEFGFADALPVPADYDGDGVTDFAIWRDGTWYIYDSGVPRLRSMRFGNTGDIPLNFLQARPTQ